MNVIASIIDCVLSRHWKVAVAESCSGGRVASLLTANPGASAWFAGGVVAYQNSVKSDLLDVPAAMIEAQGVVSEQVAIAMAQGVMQALNADVAIASTGVAGPGPSVEGVAQGAVWLAAVSRIWHPQAWFYQCKQNIRSDVMEEVAQQALRQLQGYLLRVKDE